MNTRHCASQSEGHPGSHVCSDFPTGCLITRLGIRALGLTRNTGETSLIIVSPPTDCKPRRVNMVIDERTITDAFIVQIVSLRLTEKETHSHLTRQLTHTRSGGVAKNNAMQFNKTKKKKREREIE
jgi:hypothetical protein